MIIWKWYEPIIVYRRFLKPTIYQLYSREITEALQIIYKEYENELE